QLGGENGRAIYRSFSKPHPRLPIVQHKRWGVALLELPGSFQVYVSGKPRQALRTNCARALKDGFSFSLFRPPTRLQELRAIHLSMTERQGQAVRADYVDETRLATYFATTGETPGVFTRSGELVAYVHVIESGELAICARLMGHGDHLKS